MEDRKPFMKIVEEPIVPKLPDVPPSVTVSTEGGELKIDPRLREIVGGEISLTTPRYTKISRGPLHVSYAIVDGSYYYQIEMDKEPTMSEDIVLTAIGQAFFAVVPSHIQVYIKLPPKDVGMLLYTAIAKDAANLMGAKSFMEIKLVRKILDIDFWS